MWDFIFDILGSWAPGPSSAREDRSRVGESEFEREARRYWIKWGIGLTLAGAVAYGGWWLWAR